MYGATTVFSAGYLPRSFYRAFTADFALNGRAGDMFRSMASSPSAATEFPHHISFQASPLCYGLCRME